jgi:ABC-type branched-subunit amino acid transport system substrate-binding protein
MFAPIRRAAGRCAVGALVIGMIAGLCGIVSSGAVLVNAAPASASAKSCSGPPITFTSIQSFTGSLSEAGETADIKDGDEAALKAVNAACTAGRPLKIVFCDDQSDPNQSNQCGLEAKDNGSLGLFGSVGSLPNGFATSGLPAFFTTGTSSDLTSSKAYSNTNPITLVLGSLAAAAAAGAKSYTIVLDQTPTAQVAISLLDALATSFKVQVIPVLIPASTTDYAPIAAQIAAAKPQSMGIAVGETVPLMNALAAQGVTPKTVPMFSGVTDISPYLIHQLGHVLNGFYAISQSVPAQDTSNPGIRQMLQEYAAAGIHIKDANIGASAVDIWTKVHILADALSKLSHAEISRLTSADVIAALKALGPVNNPVAAPFNFATNAYPTVPVLNSLNMFSDEALVVQVENGTYNRVSGFQVVTKPFKVDLGK